MTSKTEATIEDLYRVPENGKAEIINGELVLTAPTGFWPSRAAGAIYRSLSDHEQKRERAMPFPITQASESTSLIANHSAPMRHGM